MKMSAEVRITPGENENEDEIFKFFQRSFFLDEPMNAAAKRNPNKEDFRPMTYLNSGYSLAAYVRKADGEEQLAGVVLNKIKKRDDEKFVPRPNQTPGESIMFEIMDKLDEKTDIWSKVTSNEIFYTVILSVGREFRGLKIGQKLIEASLEKATAAGFPYATVECSSIYSSRIIENLKYEKIGEIVYEDYRDENGEVLLKVENPHKAIIKYLKKL